VRCLVEVVRALRPSEAVDNTEDEAVALANDTHYGLASSC
jgi:hypothetical protein